MDRRTGAEEIYSVRGNWLLWEGESDREGCRSVVSLTEKEGYKREIVLGGNR